VAAGMSAGGGGGPCSSRPVRRRVRVLLSEGRTPAGAARATCPPPRVPGRSGGGPVRGGPLAWVRMHGFLC
jgi:hypothetical protein